MAHAHAELTGSFGVAMVTAGPGVTNTVTAMANASLARAPVLLIGGCTSRPQANMGPLQDIPHVDLLRPVTRTARTARVADQVIREFDEAVARAMGDAGEPGPGLYRDSDRRVCARPLPPQLVLDEWMTAKPPRVLPPDPAAIARSGRGVLGGKASAGHHRARRARGRRRRWCACSMPPARSISTRRKAAAWCRPSIRQRSPPCAPPP